MRAEKIIGSGAQSLFPVEMCFPAISCGLYTLFALLSVRKGVFSTVLDRRGLLILYFQIERLSLVPVFSPDEEAG